MEGRMGLCGDRFLRVTADQKPTMWKLVITWSSGSEVTVSPLCLS